MPGQLAQDVLVEEKMTIVRQKCIQMWSYVAFSAIKDTLCVTNVCRCLIIVTQTYCITLPALGKQLILKTMYKVDQTKSWITSHYMGGG